MTAYGFLLVMSFGVAGAAMTAESKRIALFCWMHAVWMFLYGLGA